MTTSNIIHFVPQKDASAQANIEAFVASCRPLIRAIPGAHWDEDVWDVSAIVRATGRGSNRLAASFTTHDASGAKTSDTLSQPYLDVAKAYFLYAQGLRPKQGINPRLAAIRVLEKALLEATGRSNVEATNGAICNIAAGLIRERFATGTAYHVAGELAFFVELLSQMRLVSVPFQWKNPLPRGKDKNRVGVEADEARASKLPSKAALDALPKCFLIATEIPDVLVTSVAALLCTAPDRIGEVFSLPVDCEVEEMYQDELRYGLRWWPEKGAAPMVKWIVPTMVEVAKEAVSRLRQLSEPARVAAAWYEENPGKLYLPDGLEYLRYEEFLTQQDIPRILGGSGAGNALAWARKQKIEVYEPLKGERLKRVRFADVEEAILRMLPRHFPIICPRTGLRYSQALLVIRLNELHSQRGTYLCMVEPVTTGQINDGLGCRVQHGFPSVFSRLGFTEPDGTPIKITSHQFRHWLNTLAHRGGLSQIDIAKWSGRKDVRQNTAYDHMTSSELIAMVRDLDEDDDRVFGPLAELMVKAPVSRDEFLQLEFPTAHITDLGFCVHDFTMLPCQKHRDCVQCSEHVCVKGDAEKTRRIKEQMELAEAQLRRAEEASAEGYAGAERWHDHHTASVLRLRNLVAILEDPTVPKGSLIKLINPNEYSAIGLAMHDRIAATPNTATNNDLLTEMHLLRKDAKWPAI